MLLIQNFNLCKHGFKNFYVDKNTKKKSKTINMDLSPLTAIALGAALGAGFNMYSVPNGSDTDYTKLAMSAAGGAAAGYAAMTFGGVGDSLPLLAVSACGSIGTSWGTGGVVKS